MGDAVTLPGRLGQADMVLNDDPRSDPRLVAVLAELGLGGASVPSPVDVQSEPSAIFEFLSAAEEGFTALAAALVAGAPPIDNVRRHTEVVKGVDGNDISLYIHTPTDIDGPVPGLIHLHGGAMAILEASGIGFTRWRDELASSGLVVIGVEFRNSAGNLGPFPFPAGLNDCFRSLEWAHENRAALGVSKLVMLGESGGANLALATALKAKQERFLDAIDGVYAQCPYISGRYLDKDPALPSLYENDEYWLSCERLGLMAHMYSPTGADDTNPLAWPSYATADDMQGLAPHVISVNQLDPLRDEGLAYFTALLHAGVDATSRTLNGVCHVSESLFRNALPDLYLGTVRDINGFANSL